MDLFLLFSPCPNPKFVFFELKQTLFRLFRFLVAKKERENFEIQIETNGGRRQETATY